MAEVHSWLWRWLRAGKVIKNTATVLLLFYLYQHIESLKGNFTYRIPIAVIRNHNDIVK